MWFIRNLSRVTTGRNRIVSSVTDMKGLCAN